MSDESVFSPNKAVWLVLVCVNAGVPIGVIWA